MCKFFFILVSTTCKFSKNLITKKKNRFSLLHLRSQAQMMIRVGVDEKLEAHRSTRLVHSSAQLGSVA